MAEIKQVQVHPLTSVFTPRPHRLPWLVDTSVQLRSGLGDPNRRSHRQPGQRCSGTTNELSPNLLLRPHPLDAGGDHLQGNQLLDQEAEVEGSVAEERRL